MLMFKYEIYDKKLTTNNFEEYTIVLVNNIS